MKYTLIILLLLTQNLSVFPQNHNCDETLLKDFISEGQQYVGKISNGESTKFNLIFKNGCIYRLLFCNDHSYNNVNYIIRDSDKKEIFNSQKYNYPNYWDFIFSETIACTIEASITGDEEESCNAFIDIYYKFTN